METYNKLDIYGKVGFWGSLASLIALLPLVYSLIKLIVIGHPQKVIREFFFVFNNTFNKISLFLLLSSSLYLLLNSQSLIIRLVTLVLTLSGLLLTISFFLRQNKQITRQLILSHIEKAIKKHGGICTAIKFDIDLLVAINDYSYSVGGHIVSLLKNTLSKHERFLRMDGKDITSIDIPESDEVIWILPKVETDEAADLADAIRREVKRELNNISYYKEACEFVIGKLKNPPLNDEEKEGIGTVSAGVAAYTRGVETLLSDISSAAKESKFRGRNRTIIYQREGDSIIRKH